MESGGSFSIHPQSTSSSSSSTTPGTRPNNPGGSNNLVLKNLQAFLSCKKTNPNCASATAAAAGTLLSLSLINTNNGNNGMALSGVNNGHGSDGPLNLESPAMTAGNNGLDGRRSETSSDLPRFRPNSNNNNGRNVSTLHRKVSSRISGGSSGYGQQTEPTNLSISASTYSSTNAHANAMDDSRRNRSANYSAIEKEIFISTVNPFKYILEDKRFDSETLQEKAGAWRNIVSIYNSHPGVVRRDRKQLKELWKRLKDRARRSGSYTPDGPVTLTPPPSSSSSSGVGGNKPKAGSGTPNANSDVNVNASSSKLMRLAMLANAATATATAAAPVTPIATPSHISCSSSTAIPRSSPAMISNSNSNSNFGAPDTNYTFPLGSYGGIAGQQGQQLVFHAAGDEDSSSSGSQQVHAHANTHTHAHTHVLDGRANPSSVPRQTQLPGQVQPRVPGSGSGSGSGGLGGPVVKKITSTRIVAPPADGSYGGFDAYGSYKVEELYRPGVGAGAVGGGGGGNGPEGGDGGAGGGGAGGGGRGGQSRELTPEADDMKHSVNPTPPPLKEHMLSSLGLTPNPPSSQTASSHPPLMGLHPSVLPQAASLVGGLGSLVGRVGGGPQGGLHNNINHTSTTNCNPVNNNGPNPNFSGGPSSGNSSASSPPPRPSSSSTQSNPITLKESPPQQMLCVRWGNFDSNIISMFSKLKTQESFVDVTLWCEGKTVKCHKIILSACSTYFETLLTETPNSHPIIFLKDMKYWEIQALVEFMYKGEVSIHQEKLQSLLRAAESLQIKGLGSPSNERNGFGTHNGTIGDERPRSNASIDGDENISAKGNFRQSVTPSAQRQQPRALFNSSVANSINNVTNNHSLLKNSQYNNHSVGIDLSNHGSVGGKSINSSPPLSSSGYEYGGSIPAKRRKKETPRKIGNTSILPSVLTRGAQQSSILPQIPIQYALHGGNNLTPLQLAQMQQQQEYDDDNGSINDSMDEDEGNNVDMKPNRNHQSDNQNEDSNDGGDHDRNYNENDQGGQSNEEFSDQDDGDDEPGFVINEDAMDTQAGGGDDDVDNDEGNPGDGDGDDEDDNALDLGTNATADQRDRERSRKGNPIKKIHLGNNNNNYNEEDESTPAIQATLIQMASE